MSRSERRTTVIIAVILSVGAVILAVTAMFLLKFYFGGREEYFGNTILELNHEQIDVSNRKVSDVYNDYVSTLPQKFVLIDNGQMTELDLRDTYQGALGRKDFESVIDGYEFWNYVFGRKTILELNDNLTYSKESINIVVQRFIQQHGKNTEQPQNAELTREDGKYTIKEEVKGNYLDDAALVEDIYKSCLRKQYTLNTDNYYIKPEITTATLDVQHRELMELLRWSATYDNSTVIKMEDYQAYISEDENGKIQVNYAFLDDAINKLRQRYDGQGGTFIFKSTLDGIIEITGGTYGSTINAEEEKKYLQSMIEKRIPVQVRTPVWQTKAYSDDGGIGSTYIEVDISAQHVWMYENGRKIWDSDCVTGQIPQNATPTGVYFVINKATNTYLTGPTWNEWVDYWVGLTTSGIGIHDAQWREAEEFGGTTYATNGSHGCINLPLIKMGEVFRFIEEGMPVVIHN